MNCDLRHNEIKYASRGENPYSTKDLKAQRKVETGNISNARETFKTDRKRQWAEMLAAILVASAMAWFMLDALGP